MPKTRPTKKIITDVELQAIYDRIGRLEDVIYEKEHVQIDLSPKDKKRPETAGLLTNLKSYAKLDAMKIERRGGRTNHLTANLRAENKAPLTEEFWEFLGVAVVPVYRETLALWLNKVFRLYRQAYVDHEDNVVVLKIDILSFDVDSRARNYGLNHVGLQSGVDIFNRFSSGDIIMVHNPTRGHLVIYRESNVSAD